MKEATATDFLDELIATQELAGGAADGRVPEAAVLEMVDRTDDLQQMIMSEQNEETRNELELIRTTLVGVLEMSGTELVHSETWDPSLQRAITKHHTPGLTKPSILRFGSTGLRRHGELVRKQEVVLGVPIEES